MNNFSSGQRTLAFATRGNYTHHLNLKKCLIILLSVGDFRARILNSYKSKTFGPHFNEDSQKKVGGYFLPNNVGHIFDPENLKG